MPNRSIPKKLKMGYALYINRTGNKGGQWWERVGFLFTSSLEASTYREREYPGVNKWSVQAVRVPTGAGIDKSAVADNLVEKDAE